MNPDAIENQTTETPENAAPSVETNVQLDASNIETAQPAKRRRGRPSGKTSEASTAPEKENPAGATPNKQRKSSAKAGAKMELGALAKQLVGLHQLGFMVTGGKFPEIQISETEAQMLAQGVVAVCDEYDLSINGKTGAMLQLFGAAAMVYMPRILAVRNRLAQTVEVHAHDITGAAN